MSGVELKANDIGTVPAIKRRSVLSSVRVMPVLATLAAVAVAGLLGWAAWQYYMGSPWTRDGTVRAYVVKIAPQVAGEIVKLPVADNQFVHKGDLLMLIDPRNYSIAVRQAQAAVEQARAVAVNANAEMIRREKLNDIAVTMEERQTYISQAVNAEASYQSALANLDQARINFKRTQVRSPVNGYVTNLSAQLGDYANVGDLQLSIVNSELILGRRLFRGDGSWPDPGRRRRDDQADGVHALAARQSSGAFARHQCPERAARRLRASPRSIRSSPSCASLSACRCAFTSMRSRRRSSSSPA